MAKLSIDLSSSSTAMATVKKELYAGYGETLGIMLKRYGYDLERFTVTIVNALKKNPKLINCTKESLLSAVLASAELGLEIDNPMGYCFMIPFNNSKAGVTEAKFIIGYKGIIELLYRSEKVIKVVSEIVYEKDDFEYITGSELKLIHKPFVLGEAGKRIATYTIVFLSNGEKLVQLVRADQIDKIKKFSPVPELYEEAKDPTGNMWKKAGIRQIIKYTPKNMVREIDLLVERDERVLSIKENDLIALEEATIQHSLPEGEFGGLLFDEMIPVAKEDFLSESLNLQNPVNKEK